MKRKKYLHVPPDLEYVCNNNFISIRTCQQEVPENILVVAIHAKNRRSLRQAILGYRPIGKIHQWAEPWTNICLHLANFLDLSIVLRTVLKRTEMTPEINMKDYDYIPERERVKSRLHSV